MLKRAEQPRSGEGFSPGTDIVSRPLPVVLPGTAPESRQSGGPPRRDKQETTGTRPEGGEAIVVGCALVEPARFLTEEYGVVVGHTLVDASSGSGRVLIVNPNAEGVVLPSLILIGKLVPVAAISVAMEDTGLPQDGPAALPEYLEEIAG